MLVVMVMIKMTWVVLVNKMVVVIKVVLVNKVMVVIKTTMNKRFVMFIVINNLISPMTFWTQMFLTCFSSEYSYPRNYPMPGSHVP